ncbi:hypothetical protein NBY09_02765 [Elizabethkingia anophelis]|uniref:hypothetical protein n=1 Tax=Elizabethkingia anophelis TaxID=1117645 RepID=UPI002350DB52|nr:hypothetical protein [Elizabethkingia anophelis]MDC8025103.1 hypothetical protein [Elizabethkingia anophelis]
MRKNIIRLISRQVWKQSLQNKGIFFLLVLLSCLFVFAAYTGWKNYSVQEEIRTEHQQEVRQQWESKPDKHPHRMAHYGYLIFRPRYPLSFFDSGLERYTGNSVFLEAHKQNTANFRKPVFHQECYDLEKLVLQWFFRSLFLYLSFSLVSAVSLLKGKTTP